MANTTKLNRVFNYVELNYQNLSDQITNWVGTAYKKSSVLFNSASPYGQILDVVKEFFLQNILILKNYTKQLDIEQANTKRMVANISRISGHNPSRAISAKGTLKFKLKQGINITEKVADGKITIYDDTLLKNKTNSLYYSLKVGTDKNIYTLTPGCQFFTNIVQGKYDKQTFTGDGTIVQSFQVNVSNNSIIDNFDFQVSLNGIILTIKDHLADLLQNEYACYTKTGFNGGMDVYFGNGINGIIPPIGSIVEVKYLLTNGLQGNILNPKVNDFTFVDDIYDNAGVPIQVNQIFDLFVETDIVYASDGESLEYTKTVIPYVSRNYVLATPPQFIYHLKKLNMFSSVNAFNTLDMIKIDIDSDGTLDAININEMYLYLIPRITDYFSSSVNYFNVTFDKFYLDEEEKQRILTYLKKQGIVSITSSIKIIQPIIKKFIVNIFVRRYDDVSQDNIREEIVNTLSTYFSTYNRYDRVIKADLIRELKNIDGIDSVNLEFVSKDNEDYHKDGAILSTTTKGVLETTYATTTNSVDMSANSYRQLINSRNSTSNTNTSRNSQISPYLQSLSLNSKSASVTGIASEKTSVGNTTIVSYKDTQYNSKALIGVDPVLGDIVIQKNELVILRGGWSNRNGVYFHEDPKSTDGFSTINVIWKDTTPRK